MARAKKEAALTPEERLQAALVPDWEWPYKLPENWCWTRHNSIMDIVGGAQPEKAFFIREPKEGYVQLYQTRDYGENPVPVYIPQKYATKTTDEGDILLARYGGSLGKVFRAHKGAYNVALAKVIILYPEVVDDEFLYLYYYSHFYQDFCIKAGYGRSAQAGFNKSDLNELLFPLPPLAEQQRIVDRIESLFAKLDEAKEKAQAVVDSFETRKAAILHKAFTGELTAKWREEHGVRMESWEQCSLSDVCTVNPKKADTKDLPDELEVSFFPMSALSEIYGDITDPQTRLLKEVRSGFTNFSEGDVVFAKITPCMENGKSAVVGKLVNDIGYGTTEFFVLRCSDRLYNRFLYHLVRDKLFRDKAKAVMAGAVGQQRVPKRYLETYKLNLPKFNEQREIVRILDGSFAKEQQTKEAAEAVLDQIDLMKKSILARAFRGELGTNDPNEESAVELLKKVSHMPAEIKSKTKRKFVPQKIEAQIKTDLERKIIMAFIQNDAVIMPIQQLMSVSSRKFDVIETLRNLQERGILLKENDTYKLMG